MEGNNSTDFQLLQDNSKYRIERVKTPSSSDKEKSFHLLKTNKSPMLEDTHSEYLKILQTLQGCTSIFMVPELFTVGREIYSDFGHEPLSDIYPLLELNTNELLSLILNIARCIEGLYVKGISVLRLSKDSVFLQPLSQEVKLFDISTLVINKGGAITGVSTDLSRQIANLFTWLIKGESQPNHQLYLPCHKEVPPQLFSIIELLSNCKYNSIRNLCQDISRIFFHYQELGICPSFGLNIDLDRDDICHDAIFVKTKSVSALLDTHKKLPMNSKCFTLVWGPKGVGKSTAIQHLVSTYLAEAIYIQHSSLDLAAYGSLNALCDTCLAIFVENLGIEYVRKTLTDMSQYLPLVCKSVSDIVGKVVEYSINEIPDTEALANEIYTLVDRLLGRPLVIHLSDLSCIDRFSLDILCRLSQDPPNRVYLFVESNDAEFYQRLRISNSNTHYVKSLPVAPFSASETRRYVHALLGLSRQHDTDNITNLIHSRSLGIPRVITTILNLLKSNSLITRSSYSEFFWDIESIEDFLTSKSIFSGYDIYELGFSEFRLLAILSSFDRKVDLNYLNEIMNVGDTELSDLYRKLLDKSLISRGSDNYVLLMDKSIRDSVLKRWNSVEYEADRHILVRHLLRIVTRRSISSYFYDDLTLISVTPIRIEKYVSEGTFQLDFIYRLIIVAGSFCIVRKYWESAHRIFETFQYIYDMYASGEKNQVIYILQQSMFIAKKIGNVEVMESILLELAKISDEIVYANSCLLLISEYKDQGRYIDAIESGILTLRKLGFKVPSRIRYRDIATNFLLAKWLVNHESDLIYREISNNPTIKLQTRILIELGIACYNASSEDDKNRYELYMPYFALRCLIISIENGYTEYSCHALVSYGLLCHMLQGDIDTAYEFYDLGKRVRDRFSNGGQNDYGLEFYFHGMTQAWREPVQSAIEGLGKVKSLAFQSGQSEFAGYISGASYALRLVSGENYDSIRSNLRSDTHKIDSLEHQTASHIHSIYEEHISAVSSNRFDKIYEDVDIVKGKYGSNASVLFAALFLRMYAHYYAGDYLSASRYHKEAKKRANTGGRGLPYLGYFKLLGSLNEIALLRTTGIRLGIKKRITSALSVSGSIIWLAYWAGKERSVFYSKFSLLFAEFLNTIKIPFRVSQYFYKLALKVANMNNLIIESNIANELYASRLIDHCEFRAALDHLTAAYSGYVNHGIKVKEITLHSKIGSVKKYLFDSRETYLYSLLSKSFNSADLKSITEDIIHFITSGFDPLRIVIGISANDVLRISGHYQDQEFTYLNTDYQNYRSISKPLVSHVLETGQLVYVADPKTSPICQSDSYCYSLNSTISCFRFGKVNKRFGFVYFEGMRTNIQEFSEDSDIVLCLQGRIDTIIQSLQEVRAKEVAIREAEIIKQRDCNLSHEIRTPLSGIVSLSKFCLEKKLSDHELQSYMETIYNESVEMTHLVEDILTGRSIEEGKIVLSNEVLNLKETLESVVHLFSIYGKKKDISFISPDYDRLPLYIESDPVKLKQIIRNLLTNAYKFTDKGSISLSLEVLQSNSEIANFLLKVKDTGCGIAAEHLNEVFEKGYQSDASNELAYRGNGLGLWMIKAFAQRMGGDAKINCQGVGTEVFVTFRARIINSLPKEIRSEAFQCNALSEGKKVLVAEDHPTNQKVFKLLLEEIGIAPVIVGNGKDAVSRCISESFDLIILDLNMPIMNGYQAHSEIRKLRNQDNTPIVAVSAYGDSAVAKVIDEGFDDFLQKPVRDNQFFLKMSQWLSTSISVSDNHINEILESVTLTYLDPHHISKLIDESPIGFCINIQTFEDNYYRHIKDIARDPTALPKNIVLNIFHRLSGSSGEIGLCNLTILAKLCEEKFEEGSNITRETLSLRLEVERCLSDIRTLAKEYKKRSQVTTTARLATNEEIVIFKKLLKNKSMKSTSLANPIRNRLCHLNEKDAFHMESSVYDGDYLQANLILDKLLEQDRLNSGSD